MFLQKSSYFKLVCFFHFFNKFYFFSKIYDLK